MSRSLFLFLPLLLAASLSSALAAPVIVRVQRDAIQPNGTSGSPAVSADGTVVAFSSVATNLVDDPTTGALFVHDLVARRIDALLPYGAALSPSISADGRYIAFTTDANGLAPGTDSQFNDVLRVDRSNGSIARVTRGIGGAGANGNSETPAISGDGRLVAFTSLAGNLVAGTTAGRRHIYLADMDAGTIELVSRPAGAGFAEANQDSFAMEANAMSSDGNRLVFTSAADNIAPVFNGNVSDVIVRTRDPASGAISYQNVNRSIAGQVGGLSSSRGSISPNGRYVVFRSGAANILPEQPGDSDLFVRDLSLDTLRAVKLPAGYISCNRARVDDGGGVLMQCDPAAPATVQQVFFSPAPGTTSRLVSAARVGGGPSNASSGQSLTMDASGALIALESAATDLVESDTNVAPDVFLVAEPMVFDGVFRDGFE